jgi:hypothetical protein
MSLARVRIAGVWVALALAGCGVIELPSRDELLRMPLAVRSGAADTVIERVENDVDRAEVMAAVQRLATDAPLCFAWPGLWLDASTRRNVYYARYDLMERDWGGEVSARSRARMAEFVDMGLLLAVDRPDMGPGVVEYTLTAEGARALRGSPYGGVRPQFCLGAQRRVVEILDMQWGQFACGSLRVRFSHVADDYPSWARAASIRERVDATWAPIGIVAEGEVSLSRYWYRTNLLPSGETNGALRSVCLDADQNLTGDDLNLSAPPR